MKHFFYILLSIVLFYSCKQQSHPRFVFNEIETPTQASIRGLCVVDEQCLWLSGSGGTVLRSMDGGQHWKDCSIASEAKNDFRSIHAFDSLRAIVIGINNPAVIYSTSDGGTNWNTMDTLVADGLFFNSLKFADDLHGLAVSDPIDGRFLIIRTEDGGMNWTKCETIPMALTGESNFAASNTCIEFLPNGKAWMASGGSTARVYSSNNYGKTWTAYNTPIKVQHEADGIYSIAFNDQLHGIMVGGNYEHPERNDSIAAFTNDGGSNWQQCDKMPQGFRSCVQHFSDGTRSIAIAMGKTGFDYSTDNGQSWHAGNNNGYYTIRPIPGQLSAYTAGSNGRLAHMQIKMQ
ncbi:WD40/YVTN/BNR-like repeat-containing protein [Carboxylicivirga marina]|uniref:Photosynthesis system II assembly factor Ycf48/Hcf136-like domain-containing protein n=1 Tax=Carboxylicivirga marina TaxID=2800988 RepID=A0ABS1HLV7_9BACT|nr:hypothetical protein [Carboxylicivirga marina]MBK3518657.1 hypothetical protein [Carboxylicivirga marina]